MANRRLRVLLVDDSSNMRTIVGNYLEKHFEVEILQSGNGEEAENLLQECAVMDEPIDILFLDWMMPKRTGLEVLESIRSSDRFSHEPKVIMLTAETYPEQINACVKFGVSQYLTKPFSEDDLVRAVRKTLDSGEDLSHGV